MPASTYPILFFNRGLISPLGLARHDIDRGRLSAETMTNWMPRVLGSMMLRPGLQYLGATASNNATRVLPFVFSNDDTAIIEFTDSLIRVWDDDTLITRVSNGGTAITNGEFTSNLTGWTSFDTGSSVSQWVTGGYMGLTGAGDGINAAVRIQTLTPSAYSTAHTLNIVVTRGPVLLRVGFWNGLVVGDEFPDGLIGETELGTGYHSLTFTTPSSNQIRISFLSYIDRQVLVDSVAFAAAGVMTLTSPYVASDLQHITHDQSGDVVYLAAPDITQRRIVRRDALSWSIEQYLPPDGPFLVENVTNTTLTPAALSGNTTLTASRSFFKSTHAPSGNNAGALFRIESNGQQVSKTITAQNTFTDAIRVTGAENSRIFTVVVDEDAAGAATFTLQRSLISDAGPWSDVQSWTADVTTPFDDGLDNQILWYRLGVKTGDYTNGTHTVSLTYAQGSITGICRVTDYLNTTQVGVEVLQSFGGTDASVYWSEGSWSDKNGWPSAVAFHDGRLCWAGKDKVWLSVTDAFDSFDDTVIGDSGPISRSIGNGPVDQINWMVSLDRLVLGGQGAEWSVRSSSLDEPLTPTAFTMKAASTQGSAAVQAVRIDRRAVFVQRSGSRVYELNAAADPQGTDYGAIDLTQLVPEVGEPSVVRMAVQRKPDTRVHCVLSDGTVAVLVIDPTENTLCWVKVTTLGLVEDVVVLPGLVEDAVYYVVQRTIEAPVRYLERWALESEARGAAVTKTADAFVVYTGAATTVITGLSHLNAQQVSVWANGSDVGSAAFTATSYSQTYTVSGGQITLPVAATNVVVGLPYRAQWKSGKLALRMAMGTTSLTKIKRVHGFGLIVADAHAQGLFFGRDFTHMDPLPPVLRGATVAAGTIISSADEGSFTFPGDWDSDSRICFEARSPRPVTIMAAIADASANE